MAKLDEIDKAKILADLGSGVAPKIVAERHNISRATAYNMREANRKEKENAAAVDMSRRKTVLGKVITTMQETAPEEVRADLEEILNSAESLQKLEVGFHDTFTNVLTVANRLMMEPNVSIIDWQIITNTLATAFKDIFNASGTTINVAQGGAGENSLSMFQSRMKN